MSPKGTQKWSLLPGVGKHIMEVLRAEFPTPCTPAQIVASSPNLSKDDYEAVKKWCQRKEGTWVVRKIRGWYRARADPKLLAKIGMDPIKVHAIQAQMSPVQGRPPAIEGQRDTDGTVRSSWQGRKLTAQPTAEGGYLISIRASTDPISVEMFGQLTAWLYGLSGGAPVKLLNFDLATDTQNHLIRLRGAQSMELGDFHGATVKLYNKQVIEATRLETCFHRLDLGVAEAAQILHGLTQRPPEPPAPAFFGPTSGRSHYDFI